MDATTDAIVDFVVSRWTARPDQQTLAAVESLLLDSFGCMIAARNSPPVRSAVSLARACRSTPPSTVLIHGFPTSVEAAAFAGTSMVRYSDYNDTYQGVKGNGVHSSDIIPGLIALCESRGLGGRELIVGIATGYELLRSLVDSVNLRERGWDHVLWYSIAVAAVGAKLLGAGPGEIGQAVSLGTVPNIPLRQSRTGKLSMWKAAASAAAVRAGVFAAELAIRGMEGPEEPFAGEHGLVADVTGPLDLHLPTAAVPAAAQASIKLFPTEFHSQAIIGELRHMRSGLALSDIIGIDVETYGFVYGEIGNGEVKWRPTNRETADHSLPYVMATVLLHGDISLADFTEDQILDPAKHPLMDLISIKENPEFTSTFPERLRTRINIRLRDGRSVTSQISYPKGHPKNPLSTEDIMGKFRRLASEAGSPDWVSSIECEVHGLRTAESVAPLVASLCVQAA